MTAARKLFCTSSAWMVPKLFGIPWPGEYVEGRWNWNGELLTTAAGNLRNEQQSPRSVDKWVNGGNARMLVWQQDGFVFTLTGHNLAAEADGSDRQAMLMVAQSLAPATSGR